MKDLRKASFALSLGIYPYFEPTSLPHVLKVSQSIISSTPGSPFAKRTMASRAKSISGFSGGGGFVDWRVPTPPPAPQAEKKRTATVKPRIIFLIRDILSCRKTCAFEVGA